MRMRKPDWLRIKVRYTDNLYRISKLLDMYGLHTVCEEARCPNIFDCWGSGTATIMILGDTCTRNCRFCSVKKGDPGGVVDVTEPERVATIVEKLGLRYVVITSVDRDDLPDGGGSIYSKTIEMIKERCKSVYIEVLIPDFNCSIDSIKMVVDAGPDVVAHNIETVRRLTPIVRDWRAGYEKSLKVLKLIKDINPDIITKSGILLGLGEGFDEVLETFKDLRSVGVDIVTIGQYLSPSKRHFPVVEYVSPDIFRRLEEAAYRLGFKYVASGPRVRSSYLAGEYFISRLLKGRG
jgi:lipoic acid synthetase